MTKKVAIVTGNSSGIGFKTFFKLNFLGEKKILQEKGGEMKIWRYMEFTEDTKLINVH